MTRRFKTLDYEARLNQTISLREARSPNHLARCVVAIIAQRDVSRLYTRDAPVGGEAIAPEIVLGLWVYASATGLFSSGQIERATDERIPFRFMAGGWHPDHDTLANLRKTCLPESPELFVHILLRAQTAGVLKLGNISRDGSQIHAAASKSQAVRSKRRSEWAAQLRTQVSAWFRLDEGADPGEVPLPDGLNLAEESALGQERRAHRATAKAVREARAQERSAAELADSEAKLHEPEETARTSPRPPRGRHAKPPEPGARDQDPYTFTDPDSRGMQNSATAGFDQHSNVQVAVDQDSVLIVAPALSPHPNDTQAAEPTLPARPPELGKPTAGALDNGYWSQAHLNAFEQRGIAAYLATGREAPHQSGRTFFEQEPAPPPEDASPKAHMADQFQTEIGTAIYRLRQCMLEPVIGILKDVLGFRQFSLRGLAAAAGEGCLVCLAFTLKRLPVL